MGTFFIIRLFFPFRHMDFLDLGVSFLLFSINESGAFSGFSFLPGRRRSMSFCFC